MYTFYVSFLIGVIYSLSLLSLKPISTALLWALKPILQVRILCSLIMLAATLWGPLDNIGSVGMVNWSIIFFTSGFVVSIYCVSLLRSNVITIFRETHSSLVGVRLDWLRYCLSSVFIYTSIFKLVYFNEYDSQFMRESGFSDAFIYLIIAVEAFASIGLIYKRTSFYATIALLLVMIGAISTHYYNYFFRSISDPFENSSMAIALIPLLALVLFSARKKTFLYDHEPTKSE